MKAITQRSTTLASVLQWLEHWPMHQKTEGLIPGHTMYLVFRFNLPQPQSVLCRRQPLNGSHIGVSLSPYFPISLKINYNRNNILLIIMEIIYSGEDFKNHKTKINRQTKQTYGGEEGCGFR